jgi:hypothetical protein
MDYGEVLAKSWKIFWKFKVLWIFGLLASCGQTGGGGGGGGGSTSFRQNFNNPPSGANPFEQFQPLINQLQRFFEQIPVWILIIVFLAATLLALLVLIITTFGMVGLVRGAWLADEGSEKLPFSQLWRESFHYFWRVIRLFLLTVAIVIIGFAILLVPTILIGVATLGIGLICCIPLICIWILLLWPFSVWIDQALVAIVGEDKGVFESLSRSWDLIKSNIGPYIIMALILFIGSAIASFIIGIPALIIVAPFIAAIIASGVTGNLSFAGTGAVITIVLLCIYIPIAYFLRSLLTTYVNAAWTLTFRRLAHLGEAPTTPAAVLEPGA